MTSILTFTSISTLLFLSFRCNSIIFTPYRDGSYILISMNVQRNCSFDEDYCQTHFNQGHLATINSLVIQNRIKTLYTNAGLSDNGYYFGLTRTAVSCNDGIDEGELTTNPFWRWLDGTPYEEGEFIDWRANQPELCNQVCVRADTTSNHEWADRYDWEELYSFVCYEVTAPPTQNPTKMPSNVPTMDPSNIPSVMPSDSPSVMPSNSPSLMPSINPSDNPSQEPSITPTLNPTLLTEMPSNVPSVNPTSIPSVSTNEPSIVPTVFPTLFPSVNPSDDPTVNPSNGPSVSPSRFPTSFPSNVPTFNPSLNPVFNPTIYPSNSPTINPSFSPTETNNEKSNNSGNNSINAVTIVIIIIGILCVLSILGYIYFFLYKNKDKESSKNTENKLVTEVELHKIHSISSANSVETNDTTKALQIAQNDMLQNTETKGNTNATKSEEIQQIQKEETSENSLSNNSLYNTNEIEATTASPDEINDPTTTDLNVNKQIGENNENSKIIVDKITEGDNNNFDVNQVINWSTDEIIYWLQNIVELSNYTQIFIENEIDGSNIFEITSSILLEMGIKKAGHRMKILKHIKLLKN